MAGCTFPKACRQNIDLAPFLIFHIVLKCGNDPKHWRNNFTTTVKIEGEKGQINLHKLNILCNCHATSKSYLKLKQMPPQPPAAEVTLQCVGSWFSAIGCPLQNTNCSTSPAFCTFSRPLHQTSLLGWFSIAEHKLQHFSRLLHLQSSSIRWAHSSMGT